MDDNGPLSPGIESQGPRSTALSGKITSILSASYADIEIRDALATLDARGIQNSAETRRNLRRDVQKEIIDANGDIVKDFGIVADQLRAVGEALNSLRSTCADIRKHVVLARTETKPMLDEASSLLVHRSQVETKQRVLQAFNQHFLLSDDELRILTSGAEPVDDNFFLILVKAKRIHKDCQTLLSSENQRLGLEILDQSTKHLNAAFQKLYRWIQREFKNLDLENPRISASIRRALRVLAERPTLFQNCLDTFAEARERTLSESFYAALTGTNSQTSDSQKPIDFSAHEPLRYVGDMLAWVHSTTVSEREALEALFISEGDEIAKGIEEGLESEPWARAEHDSVPETFDGRKALSQLVNRSLAGVAHLLSQRIDQVVHSHDDPVLAYRIANLVSFYHHIFTKLVTESGFLDTLRKIESTALDRFRTNMQFAVGNLQGEIGSAPADLTPPDFLPPALDSVRALLKSYETSMSSSAAIPSAEDTDSGLAIIYAEALDPFLATCSALAKTLDAPSADIFSVNYIRLTLSTLTSASADLTAGKASALEAELDTHVSSLIAGSHDFLLETSGLLPLLAATETSPPLPPASLAKTPAFDPAALAEVSLQLDAFLPSAIMDAEARLGGLKDKDVLREVVRGAADGFVKDFEKVEEVLFAIDEVNGVDAGESSDDEEGRRGVKGVFPRTTEEVRVLLS